MRKEKQKNKRAFRRKSHTRWKLKTSHERPRMCVYRSNKNISCQIIDDETGKTLVSAGTFESDSSGYGGNCDAATTIGSKVAEKAMAAGIKSVAFDRGPYKYHGRVAALANAAREAGLEF